MAAAAATAAMLPEVFVGSPPALAASSAPAQAAVTGSDAGLYYKQDLDPFAPSVSYTAAGGGLIAAPAVVSVPDPNAVQFGSPLYLATGTDHALWVRSNTQSWQRFSAGATYCIDNPAGVVVRAHAASAWLLTVACQGADHALWIAQELVASGSLPAQGAPWQSLGGGLVSGPAVAAVAPNGNTVDGELTFFVDGTDGRVWTRTVASGWVPTPWGCIGHPAAGGALTSLNPMAYTQIAVFACQGTDHQLWTSTNTGAGWTAARPWGGVLVDGPGIAVGPSWWTVYAEGTDGHLWQQSFSPQNLTGWLDAGGLIQHGAGAAALLANGDNP